MVTPPFLKPGDSIGLVSTARRISHMEIAHAIDKFREWGLNVIPAKNIYAQQHQFAGTDEQRASDLQQMLDDTDIKAIIIARGGYGTLRIIDKIDFSKFVLNPKWIVGFSDVTVLHSHIHQNFRIETIHATMPLLFPADGKDDNSIQTLKKALFGEKLQYSVQSNPMNRLGETEGAIVGGNLSLLYALAGSASDISTDRKILFIEDLDEYLYHIDRMMMQLKRSGKLHKLAGLVVGGMTEMKDNEIPFGRTANEIIADALAEYDYPVCFGFPAGHLSDNRALILGRNVKLNITKTAVDLKFD